MIRVLHVLGSMKHGGIQAFLMNIYRNIDRTKVQFDFLLTTKEEGNYNNEIRELGGRIFSVYPRNQGFKKNINSLEDFFDTHSEYKIIHQHVSSLTYVAPLKIAKRHNIPIRIVHGHSTKEGGSKIHSCLHRWNQNFVESFATNYFACSDLAAKWLFPIKQYKAGRFTIINNGIDTNKFIFNNKIRNKYRRVFNLENKFVIGHIGRFDAVKNHSFLIDIFEKIQSNNPDSVLMLVGDGALRAQIEMKVKDLELTDKVIFTGNRFDISELLQAMDVFIFPSYFEGLGIALVEAQASGLKCFTSDKVVPKEVNLLGLVNFIDLNKSAEYWASEVLRKENKRYARENTTEIIKKLGYDIKQIARELQEWYISKTEL